MARFFLFDLSPDRVSPDSLLFRGATWIEASLPRLLWTAARLLPTDAASAIGAWLGRRIGPHLRHQGAIRRNLELAFPELDTKARAALLAEIWSEAGRILIEFALLDRICGAEARDRLEFVLRHDPKRARTGERPAMYVTAHLANWELGAAAATLNGVRLSIVSTPQPNAFVQAALEHYRNAIGCRLVPSHGGLRTLMRDVADGRSLGWIVDQRHDQGEPVPFFGMEALTATMPALLALKLHCDLVPVRVERIGGCRFRITAYEGLSRDGLEHLDQRAAARELTARLNRQFEQWIRERPGQWLCFKRRWPKSVAAARSVATERARLAVAPFDNVEVH